MTDSNYDPGSFGCHEALHMAAFLSGAVCDDLVEHRAIQANPEWLALATQAMDALVDLYQKIGAAHLEAPFPTPSIPTSEGEGS